jgi:hypothetical protein
MNKYLKTYIRNRDIIFKRDRDKILKNIEHYEVKYFIDELNDAKIYYDQTEDLARLISKNPELIKTIKKIEPSLFNVNEISIILRKQPNLYKYFKSTLQSFSEYELYIGIVDSSHNIEIIKDLIYKINNIEYIENIIVYYPQTSIYFEEKIKNFDGINIRNILFRNINSLKYLYNYLYKLNKEQIKELNIIYPDVKIFNKLDIKYGKYLNNYDNYGQYYEN